MPAFADQRDDSLKKSASNARPNGTNVRRSLITSEGRISPRHGDGGGGQYGVLIEGGDAGTTNQLAGVKSSFIPLSAEMDCPRG